MTLSTLETCIEIVRLLALQPSEVAVRSREVIETRKHPTEDFVYVITLWNQCYLRSMCSKHRLVIGNNTSERITIEDTNITTVCNIVCENLLQWSTNEGVNITRLLYHTTCNGNTTSEVYLTSVKQATKEDNGCWLNSPYHLTLIHWVDMIYLHTNITCRTRTIENSYLNILCTSQR